MFSDKTSIDLKKTKQIRKFESCFIERSMFSAKKLDIIAERRKRKSQIEYLCVAVKKDFREIFPQNINKINGINTVVK